MIYLAVVASILAAFGGYRRFRSHALLSLLLDIVASAVAGWIAGLLLGVGARIGMWAVPFFNGTGSRFSFDGSLSVVLTFSVFGIGLGIIYELVFRRLFRERGWLFGLSLSALTVYPLGRQGVELLNFSPPVVPLAFFTFLFMAIIFVPFSIALEFFVRRWHRFHDVEHESLAVQ